MATKKVVFHLLRTQNYGTDRPLGLRQLMLNGVFRELIDLVGYRPNPRSSPNWFSLQNAQRLHKTFLALDADCDGFITREEFARFEPGMTSIFIDRIFDEHLSHGLAPRASGAGAGVGAGGVPSPSLKRRSSLVLMRQQRAAPRTCKGRMSLDDFLTFAIAWTDKKSKASLSYFFKVFDIHNRGFLTHVEIHTFFKEVYAKYMDNGTFNEIRMEDVRDEIFDMVKSSTPGRITMRDIYESHVHDIFVDVLADMNGFWRYDNREYLMQMEDED